LPALLTGGLLLAAAPGASAADSTLSQVLDAAKQALQGNRQEPSEPPRSERPEYRERDHYDQRDDHRNYDRERYSDRDYDQRDDGRDRYSDRDSDRAGITMASSTAAGTLPAGIMTGTGTIAIPSVQRASPSRSRRATSRLTEAGPSAVIRLPGGWAKQVFTLTAGRSRPASNC
jgi:hypothetical protein